MHGPPRRTEFDTASASGEFLLRIFASVAEFERNLISESTKMGLANARKRKKLLGRPKEVSNAIKDKDHYTKLSFMGWKVKFSDKTSRIKRDVETKEL